MSQEVERGAVVIPGDTVKISQLENSKDNKIILGPGLRRVGDSVLACKAGILRMRSPAIYYVDSYQRR